MPTSGTAQFNLGKINPKLKGKAYVNAQAQALGNALNTQPTSGRIKKAGMKIGKRKGC